LLSILSQLQSTVVTTYRRIRCACDKWIQSRENWFSDSSSFS